MKKLCFAKGYLLRKALKFDTTRKAGFTDTGQCQGVVEYVLRQLKFLSGMSVFAKLPLADYPMAIAERSELELVT